MSLTPVFMCCLSFTICVTGTMVWPPVKLPWGLESPQNEGYSICPGACRHFLLGSAATPGCGAWGQNPGPHTHWQILHPYGVPLSLDSTFTSFLTTWRRLWLQMRDRGLEPAKSLRVGSGRQALPQRTSGLHCLCVRNLSLPRGLGTLI